MTLAKTHRRGTEGSRTPRQAHTHGAFPGVAQASPCTLAWPRSARRRPERAGETPLLDFWKTLT